MVARRIVETDNREIGEPADLVHRDRHTVGNLGDTRVAGGAIELRELRALAKLPAQGVLSAPRTDDQNLHDQG